MRLVIVPGSAPSATATALLAALGPGAATALAGGGSTRAHDAAREHFLGNEQGGFRVTCPLTGDNVSAAAGRAIQRWRDGGERALTCACGSRHDLAALDYAPGAVFAERWIEVLEPAEIEVRQGTILDQLWPGWRAIVVRG